MEATERKRPTPAPTYGPRKTCSTRMAPELVARLQSRFELANERRRAEGRPELSFGEGLAQLAEWALSVIEAREQKEKGAVQKPKAQPAPVVVSVTVEELTPSPAQGPLPSDTGSALWTELLSRLRPRLGADIAPLEACTPVSYDGLRLTLSAPTPYLASDLQERIGGLVSALATDLVGELVEVVWVVSADYERRMAETETRCAEREVQRDQEDAARKARAAKLTVLYTKGDPSAAKEAGVLLVEDASLLSLLPAPSRKLIEQWINSTRSGADYQTAKESAGHWGKSRGRR